MSISQLFFIYAPFVYFTPVGTQAGYITAIVTRTIVFSKVKFDVVFEYPIKNEHKSIVGDLCSFLMIFTYIF